MCFTLPPSKRNCGALRCTLKDCLTFQCIYIRQPLVRHARAILHTSIVHLLISPSNTQVRIVFLSWLPCLLRMKRPGRPYMMEYPSTMYSSSDSSSERKHPPPSVNHLNDVELKERSSKSLLANVLDIDDDFRHSCRPLTPAAGLPPNPAFFRMGFG